MIDFYSVPLRFPIGFVPTGWEKGEKLYIVNPTTGHNALVGQVWQLGLKNLSREFRVDSFTCLTFTAADIDAVNAWLEWWYGND